MLRSKIRRAAILLLTLVLTFKLVGCNGFDRGNSGGSGPGAARDTPSTEDALPTTAADEAWTDLFATKMSTEHSVQDRSLEDYLARLESGKDKLLRDGAAFWSEHPDDSRRLEWLKIAVRIAPGFFGPQNGKTSVEASTTGSCYDRDYFATAKWIRQFSAMRDEAEQDGSVSPMDKAVIDFALADLALSSEYHRVRCRGLEDFDPGILEAAELVLKEYSDKGDRSTLEAEYKEKLARLQQKLSQRVAALEEIISTRAKRFDAVIGEEDTTPVILSDSVDLTLAKIQESLLDSHLTRRGETFSERFLYHINKITTSRIHREYGMEFWSSLSADSKLDWYQKIIGYTQSSHAFATDPINAAWVMADDPLSTYATDDGDWSRWYEMMAVAHDFIWNELDLESEWHQGIRGYEVRSYIQDAVFRDSRTGGGNEVESKLHLVHELYVDYGNEDMTRRLSASITRNPEYFDVSEQTIREFMEPFAGYESDALRALYSGSLRRAQFRSTALELSLPTFDGRSFDLKELRGSKVFLMFWSTSCASCIEAMPGYKRVYDKYREYNFEVVAICNDAVSNRRKVQRILDENELSWINLNGEGKWGEFNEEFGFGRIVPQYFLFDEDGLMLADTTEISSPADLSIRLERLFEGSDFGGLARLPRRDAD